MMSKKSNQDAKKPNPSTSSSKNFKVITTDNFIKEAKKLKKKYPSISGDFAQLQTRLKKDPITGNDFLGTDCYKVRMPISDKNCGDRGGARVIIEVKIVDKKVYVLSVYDKGDKSTIFESELDKILKKRLDQFPD